MNSRPNLLWLGALLLCSTLTTATSTSPATSNGVSIVQETLTALGSRPFHLKATITERGDPTSKTEVEIFWMAPDKWRRTIKSQTEFNQTLVVNGDKFFEQDSDQYFPLWSQTLVAAMVDPKIVLDAYRPGDRLITKANGGTNESGVVCFPPTFKMCFKGRYGMMETVGAAGHSVDFMDYQEFHGKRVARRLTYRVDAGDSYTAEVTELKDLKNPDSDLFSITEASTQEKRIRSVMLPEAELRGLAQQPLEIIWPQVTDGATSGRTSYYLYVDRSGQVAEVLPLAITAERADGSARRQIMKWNFKPTVQDGIAVQTEGILSFDFNMRAYGPAEPLDDAAARKMASKIVEPILPANAVSGSSHAFSVAVDEAGNVIEIIAGDGPRELSAPCFEAVKQWRFNVMLEGGRPLPYRAQVVCRVP